jgi:osmotically-inducible protein OsmY
MSEDIERFHEESDRELEGRVTAFLADRSQPALRRLGVRSHRGVVTLRGRVKTFYEKQLGSQAARRVAGVIDVIDSIQVASDASLLSAHPGSGQTRRAASSAAITSFDSHPGSSADALGAAGFQSILQTKG